MRLFVGYKLADLKKIKLDGDDTIHVLDIYHKHAIEKNIPGLKVVASPHLPEGEFKEINYLTGPKLMSGELALDLMQEISLKIRADQANGLKVKFNLEFIGKERDKNELLNKIKDDPKRVRSFAAKWKTSVPGGEPIELVSYPGCFCHRREDQGGLALAEVASRELANCKSPLILDMGCGCGLVGALIASVVPSAQITMIDSHTRAVEAACVNAAALNLNANVVLADDGIDSMTGVKETFDVFVGNPPYYSNYRIAEVFLDTALKALKKGAVAYTVVKNEAGLKPLQEKYFKEVEVIKRRGYSVLRSVREG